MISMKDALPDMPEFCADEPLVEKIRRGQKLTIKDLTGSNGAGRARQAGDYLKIINREQGLIAIVEQNPTGERLTYCCVFPKKQRTHYL
jgi:hypothetical protein